MASLDVQEREYGAVKKSEDGLAKVPLPRRSTAKTQAAPQSQAQPEPVGTDYERDILATNPLATLPPDVQQKLHTAQLWTTIGLHPGATDFEVALANAHLDELEGPQSQDTKEKDTDKK